MSIAEKCSSSLGNLSITMEEEEDRFFSEVSIKRRKREKKIIFKVMVVEDPRKTILDQK